MARNFTSHEFVTHEVASGVMCYSLCMPTQRLPSTRMRRSGRAKGELE